MLKAIETTAKNFLRSRLVPQAIRAFRSAECTIRSVEDAVALTFDFRYCGIKIRPSQIPAEILQLLRLLRANPPRALLEIGTHKGGSFFLFSYTAAEDALLISLDLPHGKYGGGYAAWQGCLYRSFARNQQRIELVQADSHDPSTLQLIRQLLGEKQLDFLMIDGDHNYEGVKADFLAYMPLVRTGGIIAFHDIVPGREGFVGGVPRFWKEIKKDRQVDEFVASWQQGGYGIGVLYK
ncbi:MAG TPA: class I SAM-dependent methyltransferase [Candidatus Angelobacter sp.]|nr:class I SAM-dependent methyltransferase [Candidatus Angelobacter sp.]